MKFIHNLMIPTHVEGVRCHDSIAPHRRDRQIAHRGDH
jgi:hypothetical protein